MVLTERFTRTAFDTVEYAFTIDDPSTFTDKITAIVPMTKVAGQSLSLSLSLSVSLSLGLSLGLSLSLAKCYCDERSGHIGVGHVAVAEVFCTST